MSDNSCVYWIHLPEHTDMFSEGYIGVSKNGANYRYNQHKSKASSGSKLLIHNVIRKYSDKLVVSTVLQGNIEYCYFIEEKLRPSVNIGWNLSAGGDVTNKGYSPSEETRKAISVANKGKVISEETKKKMSKSARGFSEIARKSSIEELKTRLAWNSPVCDKSTWIMSGDIYNYLLEFPTHGTRKIANHFNTTSDKLRMMYKKIKSGWNPNEDTEWLVFSSKLIPDASGDKSLPTGLQPN